MGEHVGECSFCEENTSLDYIWRCPLLEKTKIKSPHICRSCCVLLKDEGHLRSFSARHKVILEIAEVTCMECGINGDISKWDEMMRRVRHGRNAELEDE